MRQRMVNTSGGVGVGGGGGNKSDLEDANYYENEARKLAAKNESNRFRKIVLLIVAVTIHNIPGKQIRNLIIFELNYIYN